MKAYIGIEVTDLRDKDFVLKELTRAGRVKEIEVGGLDETLYRKTSAGFINGEYHETYEPVTHQQIFDLCVKSVKSNDRILIERFTRKIEQLEKENEELHRYINKPSHDGTIQSLQKENDRLNDKCMKLDKCNDTLRRGFSVPTVELTDKIEALEKENEELKRMFNERQDEIAELKKNQVVWEKDTEFYSEVLRIEENTLLDVHWHNFKCTIPLPAPEKDEAEEAWENCELATGDYKAMFVAGFKAAKEIK